MLARITVIGKDSVNRVYIAFLAGLHKMAIYIN